MQTNISSRKTREKITKMNTIKTSKFKNYTYKEAHNNFQIIGKRLLLQTFSVCTGGKAVPWLEKPFFEVH